MSYDIYIKEQKLIVEIKQNNSKASQFIQAIKIATNVMRRDTTDKVEMNESPSFVSFIFSFKKAYTFVQQLKKLSKSWGKNNNFESKLVVLAGEITVALNRYELSSLEFNNPFLLTLPSTSQAPIAHAFFPPTNSAANFSPTKLPSSKDPNENSKDELQDEDLVDEPSINFGLEDENPEQAMQILFHSRLKN